LLGLARNTSNFKMQLTKESRRWAGGTPGA
jgi:hypothetical protein